LFWGGGLEETRRGGGGGGDAVGGGGGGGGDAVCGGGGGGGDAVGGGGGERSGGGGGGDGDGSGGGEGGGGARKGGGGGDPDARVRALSVACASACAEPDGHCGAEGGTSAIPARQPLTHRFFCHTQGRVPTVFAWHPVSLFILPHHTPLSRLASSQGGPAQHASSPLSASSGVVGRAMPFASAQSRRAVLRIGWTTIWRIVK